MDFLHLLWAILSFVFGLAWQAVWFILRDLISTVVWVLIAVWLILSVRYRSFSLGALTLARFGSYGLRLFWRWLRNKPGTPPPTPPREKPLPAAAKRYRKPFGTVSISEELNMLLAGAILLLFLA